MIKKILNFFRRSSPPPRTNCNEFNKKINDAFQKINIVTCDIPKIIYYTDWALLSYTDDILRKDIVIQPETEKAPFYLINVVDKDKELIISIRGTQTGKDLKTDLNVGLDKPYHIGIMNAAIDILITQDLLNKWILPFQQKGYRCVIVGHSLGAGISAYILLCVRLFYPQITNIHVYLFGCPSIIPVIYNYIVEPYMTSVVNNDDLISILPLSMTWVIGGEKNILHLIDNKIIQRHWSYFKDISENNNIFDHSLIAYLKSLSDIK